MCLRPQSCEASTPLVPNNKTLKSWEIPNEPYRERPQSCETSAHLVPNNRTLSHYKQFYKRQINVQMKLIV